MAIPSSVPFKLTGDNLIDATTHGYFWNLDPSRTIRWAIANGLAGEAWADPGTIATQISTIFSSIASFANVNFVYAGWFASPVAASPYSDITISLSASTTLFPNSSIWGSTYFPNASENSHYPGAAGDVFVNANSPAVHLPSYAPGSAGYFLFMHEIGHALGLKHPHDDGGTGRPTLESLGAGELDNDWFTVMSYRDDFDFNLTAWDPATPMVADVLALQYLYGKNMQTNAGNTILPLQITNTYTTLWDAGGIDTIDASGSTQGWFIVLPDAQLSRLVDTPVGMAGLMSEAQDSSPTTFYWIIGDVENAIGSDFADEIQGSALNNVIRGGGGNDIIDGGAGIDTALFSNTRSMYTISRTQTGHTVAGPDGMDTLTNVERFQFADSALAFDVEGSAGQAYRLYQAAFDRKPDAPGLGTWIHFMDSGHALAEVSALFQLSDEYIGRYGRNVATDDFIHLLYQNVLHRGPDTPGYATWKTVLDTSQWNRAEVLIGFSESTENKAALIGVMQDGMDYIA